jgi:hypothetical protein
MKRNNNLKSTEAIKLNEIILLDFNFNQNNRSNIEEKKLAFHIKKVI